MSIKYLPLVVVGIIAFAAFMLSVKNWLDMPTVAFSNVTGQPVYVTDKTGRIHPVTEEVLKEPYEKVVVE